MEPTIKVDLEMPKTCIHPDCTVPVDGYEVFSWPEFQALAFRLGIDLSRRVKRLVIDLQEGACPTVLIDQQGCDVAAAREDAAKKAASMAHNKQCRTFLADEPMTLPR